jgi:hypothetical protein
MFTSVEVAVEDGAVTDCAVNPAHGPTQLAVQTPDRHQEMKPPSPPDRT